MLLPGASVLERFVARVCRRVEERLWHTGLFRLLGYRFSPRLADVGGTRFWRIDPTADYGVFNAVAKSRLNTPSLKLGKVPATGMMRILQRGDSPTRLALLKQRNDHRRSREYFTPTEIDRLIVAAKRLGHHGHRDATMILLAYQHGLRVSELVALRREQVDLRQGRR